MCIHLNLSNICNYKNQNPRWAKTTRRVATRAARKEREEIKMLELR